MAGNTKALRVRIKSVSSTLQLTKAMELVASSKIRRANQAMLQGREYVSSLLHTVDLFCADRECAESPYLKARDGKKTKLVVISGDRGLAGGYNANVYRLVAEYKDAAIIPIGKRSADRYGGEVSSSETFSFQDAVKLAKELCREFSEGTFDRVGIVYTRYRSVISQEACVLWLLPFVPRTNKKEFLPVFEPDAATVLEHFVHEYVAGMITACVRESFASEVAARRMAMDSAGKNAREMIDNLQIQYNRARQGAITQEITEIVAGSGTE